MLGGGSAQYVKTQDVLTVSDAGGTVAAGEPGRLYVADHFAVGKAGTVVDHEASGRAVTVRDDGAGDSGDIPADSTVDRRQRIGSGQTALPWSVHVVYSLDGPETTGQAIAAAGFSSDMTALAGEARSLVNTIVTTNSAADRDLIDKLTAMRNQEQAAAEREIADKSAAHQRAFDAYMAAYVGSYTTHLSGSIGSKTQMQALIGTASGVSNALINQTRFLFTADPSGELVLAAPRFHWEPPVSQRPDEIDGNHHRNIVHGSRSYWHK